MMNSMYKLQNNAEKMGWHFCLIKENDRGSRKKQEFRYWLQVFWFKISQQSKVKMSKYQLNLLRWKAERKSLNHPPVFSISDMRFCPQISFGGLRGDRWEEYVITWYCWYGFLSSRSLLWLNNDLHTRVVSICKMCVSLSTCLLTHSLLFIHGKPDQWEFSKLYRTSANQHSLM